jgi:hypothetical protein
MTHRLFNLAAGVSLLLALAVGGLWVRSGWHWDSIVRREGLTGQTIGSCAGRVWYARESGIPRGPLAWHYRHLPASTALQGGLLDLSRTWYGGLGFACRRYTLGMGGRQFVYETLWMLPDWSLVLLLAVLPVWRGWAWRRARQSSGRGFAVGPAGPAG